MSGALNPFDLFVLVVLVLATFWGGMRGIVSQVTSIFSWLASAYIATHYYYIVAKFMNASYAYYKPLAMIATFIVSALLIRIASNIVKNMVSLAGLKEFDRQMGAALGLLKGALLCLLVTFVLIILNGSSRSVVENSKSGPYFTAFISKIQRHLPESELTRRFLAYADAIEEEKKKEDDGTESKTLKTEVRDFKKYIVSKVLSDTASDIVAEAEESDSEDLEKGVNSLFQSATSAMNRLTEKTGALVDESTFQSAASSMNRLKNQLKGALSHNFSTGESSSVSDSSPNASLGDDYYDDYEADEYDSYAGSRRVSSAELDITPFPDYSSTSDDVGNEKIDAFNGLSSSDVRNADTNQAMNSRESMMELDAFFKSIGGGYGTGHRNRESSDSAHSPQNRSGVLRSPDANASRSRLNSLPYTIESSSASF